MRRRAELIQIAASLLVGLAIAAIAIVVVTAHFGPTSTAKLDAQADKIDARQDAREDRRDAREDAAEQRREEAEDAGGGSGPG